MSSKRAAIAYIFILLCCLACLVAWIFLRPAPPKEWGGIATGMPRRAILDRFPDMYTDMYEIKDLDTLTRRNGFPFFPRAYWQLTIHYGRDGCASSLGCRYIYD